MTTTANFTTCPDVIGGTILTADGDWDWGYVARTADCKAWEAVTFEVKMLGTFRTKREAIAAAKDHFTHITGRNFA